MLYYIILDSFMCPGREVRRTWTAHRTPRDRERRVVVEPQEAEPAERAEVAEDCLEAAFGVSESSLAFPQFGLRALEWKAMQRVACLGALP